MLHKSSHSMFVLSLVLILTLFLTACSNSPDAQTSGTSTPVPINGFGTAANHTHAMLALSPHVLVLATHYGLFRSEDSGVSWKEVAGGRSQLMDGLMTYALSVSPVDPQRLYVLTLLRAAGTSAPGTLGLYTSADQGSTWHLAIPTSSITPTSIFTVVAGNDTPTEVFIYIADLGTLGLRISLDAGQHFSSTGTLPFSPINGILALPGTQGQLLVYGSGGIARSVDGGTHWQIIKGIKNGVYDMTTAGLHLPIYASGDDGIYTSLDGGQNFKLVTSSASYGSLTSALTQSQVLYGETATAIYQSTDGGRNWHTLPHLGDGLHYQTLATDPTDSSQVYLALNYPVTVYRLGHGGTGWLSLTPPV